MVSRALEKYLRMSPKKIRPIARLVKTKKVEDALYLLMNANQKGAGLLKTVIESALSNAKRIANKDFDEDKLFISRIIVNEGPSLKRYRAMSLGRAGLIRKRTSHILVELDAPKKVPRLEPKSVKKQGKVPKTLKTRK